MPRLKALAVLLLLSLSLPADAAEPWESLAGKFLIARPDLDDSNFRRAVIVMIEHNPAGALGVIVNRPLGQVSIAEVMAGAGQKDEELTGSVRAYLGGPVEPDALLLLHSDDKLLPASRSVAPGLAMTLAPEMLPEIGRDRGPKESLLVFGYAGWGPGQLEAELKRGSWETQPLDPAVALDADDETKWDRAIEGVEVEL